MKSRWKTYLLYATIIVAGGGVLFLLVETVRVKNTGFETKTLWDWMELLIIPLVLASGAIWINWSEKKIERQATIDRAEIEREVAKDNQQEAALQAYLDRMAELLLKEKLQATVSEEIRNVARIRTLTVVRGLDGTRKGLVIQFLYEAGLIYTPDPIIILAGADLSEAEIHDTHLSRIDLGGVNLSKANLRFSHMENSNLQKTILQDADLAWTNLCGSNLQEAELERAILPGTNFENSNLYGAFLNGADMYGIKLSGADLTYADLQGAKAHISEIEKANPFKGTTMPDGGVRYSDDG